MYDIDLIIPTWAESAAENDGKGFVTLPRHEVLVVVREYRRLSAEAGDTWTQEEIDRIHERAAEMKSWLSAEAGDTDTLPNP